jgi:hypothetical protein
MQGFSYRNFRAARQRLGIAAVLLVSLFAACAEESTAPAVPQQLVDSLAGTYSVRFIDGSRLPVIVCAEDVKVISGTLRLRFNNTFVASARYRSPPTAPAETYQEAGTYTRQPGTNKIVFQSTSRPGVTWDGTVLSDGSIRIRYPVCGESHHVRVFRAL